MLAEDSIRLRIHSGVPIVDVLGEWETAVLTALGEMVRALAAAGHFEIIVNVQRAAVTGIAGIASLSRASQAIKKHCGHIEVVGNAEHLAQLNLQQCECGFRFAASDEAAVSHIKRTLVMTAGPRCTARPIA